MTNTYTDKRRGGLWRVYRALYIARDAVLARLLGPAAEGQELMCVLAALGYGVVIIMARHHPVPVDTALQRMSAHAPSMAWACAFLGFGVIGLTAYWRHWRRARVFCAAAGFVGWALVCYFAYAPPVPIFSAAVAPLLVLGSVLSFLRLVEVKA